MNTHLLQRYLDGHLTHEEEVRLRLDLEAKPELTAQERAVLLLLSSNLPKTSIDENWWSEEGCSEFDALMAEKADFIAENRSFSSSLSEAGSRPSVVLPAHFCGKTSVWRWASAAAVVVAVGVGCWWHAVRPFSDETAQTAAPSRGPEVKIECTPSPKPIAVAPPSVLPPPPSTSVSRKPFGRRCDGSLQIAENMSVAAAVPSVLAESTDEIVMEIQEADLRLEQEYQKYRKAEELRFAMLRLDLDYIDYCREQEELSAIETIEL